MSIMFPTIFPLGVRSLGTLAKHATGFIVMAIMVVSIVRKIMEAIGDRCYLSVALVVPQVCFQFGSAYGYGWAGLRGAAGAQT